MSALKPPIGISLARTFGKNINEETVLRTAEAMVSDGFVSAGYEYLIIGDGYALPRRDRATGKLAVDEEKFPCGMKALADKLHGMGLKLGIVTSAGAATQNGAPGCIDKEYVDAETFAEWGVDYISHDTSFMPPKANYQTVIRRMGLALRNCGRDILYSVFSSDEKLYVWARSAGAGAYCDRSFADADEVTFPCDEIAGYSADYCWHNCGEICVTDDLPAMLRSKLALCAMMSSPIIVDCDVTALSKETSDILRDGNILSIATDDEGRPARRFGEGVYVKYLKDREYALAFIRDNFADAIFSFADDDNRRMEFYSYDFGITWNAGYVMEAEGVFGAEGKTEFDAVFAADVAAGDAQVYKLRLVR